MPIAAVAIVGGVIAAGSAIKGGMDASKSASAIKAGGRHAAKVIGMEGAESKRRLKRQQQNDYNQSVARSYGSNLQMSGSNQAYLRDMISEQRREVDWLDRETKARQYAAKKGAGTQASNLQRTANTQMMASLGSMAMRVGV
jgi:hypothetical protein